ncbi:glucose-6-phosphate dehydrogenase [Microbacterium sp. W1N]|uniref:glucose-6-phosphate dehydrogenase n=1 Tax=Microbacterium festucae TaxID=2977531 RepID=UPI0021C011BF|nr:glucose-6-phosphate dehydrogenase [Microbacterium festucae]MCT9821527.1 glucose-6-phosphate dehydrogenase [Microbacterium festucae]
MAEPTTLLIIGASGDLTSRLLLPALGELLRGQPDRRVHVVGAGRTALSDTQWRGRVRTAFRAADADEALGAVVSTPFIVGDAGTAKGLRAIIDQVPEGRLVLYFAVPPAVAASACAALRPADLPDGTILALEKPFGDDEDSARELNAVVRALLPESQVFRVDHFLGRSTVLNVLGVRFANRLFEPVWSAEHVASVDIRFDETLGLEGRADYYDHAGAMIDMIQSHLLQVLAVVAMEPPATLGDADVRDATAAVLRATRIWDDNPVRSSHRARYTAGTAGGQDLPSYVDEPGVDPSRQTETLAQITCEVRTARWAGVPFTLRSGKALGDPVTAIEVRLRPVRHLPVGFTAATAGADAGAVLRFSLGPDRLDVEIDVNGGDDPFALHRATLGADLGLGAQRSYVEVLAAMLDGDATLSVRGDAAELCWRIIQPVRDAWARGDVPLEEYPAGSAGPDGWGPAPR